MRNSLVFLAIGSFALAACAQGRVGNVDEVSGERLNDHRKYVQSSNPIPNSFIVVLEDDAVGPAGTESAVASLQAQVPGEITHTYQHALNGYAVNMSQADVLKLADDPMVKYVAENGTASINESPQINPTWGLDRIDERDLPDDDLYVYNADGSGVHVYIVDTGVRTSHDEFAGRIGAGTDTIDNDSDPDDCNGHGTHVAGTVAGTTYGVAKNAIVHGVRVLNCQGSGTWAQVIGGVDWVAANAIMPAVANMSLGGGANQALNDAVAAAVDAGVFFAVAAGNENTDACTKSPASEPKATTVGSTTSSDARSSFSNFGDCVDIFAPGSNITSSWHTGDSATNSISGTSMASPHVAGAGALYLHANPNATPQQVNDGLVADASNGKVSNPGSGSPNLLLYTKSIDAGGGGERPTVDITNPQDGTTVSGTVTITATASASGNGSIASVEFLVGGTSVGTDTSSPYSISWDTNASGNGSHDVEAVALDADGNSATDSVTVTVSNGGGGGDLIASYDASLGTAACRGEGRSCDSAGLFDGRGTVGNDEPNHSNTLDGCADGNSGSYHSDESNDGIRVYTRSGNNFAAGEQVVVEADVWAWSTGSADKADVFYASDANNPDWTFIRTLSASGGGAQTVTTSFDLAGGDLQAVRVQWRYNSTNAACASGAYNDRDDLVFSVGGGGGGGGDGRASYSDALQAPLCTGAAPSCDSQTLLNGRGGMSGGAESSAPNTLASSCTDGNSGTFESDESVDSIIVSSSGGNISAGTSISININAYFWSATADSVDVYYTEDVNNPQWVAVATNQKPSATGRQTITVTHTPSSSGTHAVRAQIRWNGSASSCTSGNYNDRDDLAFEVQ